MGKVVIIAVFITLVFAGLLFFAVKTFAAVPTLQDLLAHTPKPVTDFFNALQGITSGAGSDLISKNLPVVGKPVSGFLNATWTILLVLLKGVGSIFVWIFHAVATGLEGLIFSK